LALALSALLGAVWLAHRALARRFAAGRLRPPRDRRAGGALLLLGLAASLLGPALAPDVLTRFPPHVELSLPFVAALAALGLERIAAAHRPVLGGALAAGIVVSSAWITLRAPSTLSAAFEPFFGGVGRVSASAALPVGDGSELGALARPIDSLGSTELGLHAPDVPAELWTVLRQAGRLRTFVVPLPSPRPGALELVRGRAKGDRVASVERGSTAIWTLSR
jgi:hypothetical protein